jgi:hypothetical protein
VLLDELRRRGPGTTTHVQDAFAFLDVA